MNWRMILAALSGILAGAIISFGITFASMDGSLAEAEAHAKAADERAAGCEAKFQVSTVIFHAAPAPVSAPAAAPAVGFNLLDGLVHISAGPTLSGALASAQLQPAVAAAPPQAEYVIPAEIIPRRVGTASAWYEYIDKSGRVQGPWGF